jgi:Lon protease-like protein
MTHDLEEMPLFPLNAVLLPYQTLPLHIFEERYRQMIRECLEDDRPFGVVLIRDGEEVGDPHAEPYLVGTSARVVAHKDLPDGRIDLLAVGERRFRVRRIDRTKPYPTGFVEPVVELEWSETVDNRGLLARAKEAFEFHLHNLFGNREVNVTVQFPDDPVALSFAIAGFINLPLIEKQHLLEMTDTAARFTELIPAMESQFAEYAIQGQPTVSEEFEDLISNN